MLVKNYSVPTFDNILCNIIFPGGAQLGSDCNFQNCKNSGFVRCPSPGKSIGNQENKIVVFCVFIVSLIDCLVIAIDAHMFSHNGYGSRIKDKCPKAAGSGA